jgi:CHAD domain-containing protein
MADEWERVRKALRELGKSLKSLPGNPSPAAVHKLRTAARRVEAIAIVLETSDGKRSRRLVKAMEPVRKAAGGVRDMDVLAAHARKLERFAEGPSLNRLLAHLESARQQNAAELERALDRRHRIVQERLKEYSRHAQAALKHAKSRARATTGSFQTQEEIHSAAMNLVRELTAWPPLHAENLHEFRLRVKQLRYVLQLDAQTDPGLLEALGDAQRRIGDWHDWHQLDDIAHEVLIREGDQPVLDRIDVTVRRRFDRALAAAHALRARYLAMPFAAGI